MNEQPNTVIMKTNIILVEDHTLVRNAIADLIEGNPNYTVTEQVSNGMELLDILKDKSELPDIVLLDVNMPVMDG